MLHNPSLNLKAIWGTWRRELGEDKAMSEVNPHPPSWPASALPRVAKISTKDIMVNKILKSIYPLKV